MKVKECMQNNVCVVTPDVKLDQVCKLMNQNHVGSIPVCDENTGICGIVTDRDIVLRAIACDKDVKNTPVSDIMTCNIYTCTQDDEMQSAENTMAKNQVRRLPVCDTNNNVIGILTLEDLINNDNKIGKEHVFATIEGICDRNRNKNAE